MSLFKAPETLKGIITMIIGMSAVEGALVLSALNQSEKSLALGVIVGLCAAHLGVGLGLGAILRPFPAERDIFRREAPVMFIVFIIVYLFSRDLQISRLDGLWMILLFILFLVMACRSDSFKGFERVIILENKHINGLDLRMAGIVFLLALGAVIAAAGICFNYGNKSADMFSLSGWSAGMVLFSVLIALGKVVTGSFLYKKSNNLNVSSLLGANIFNLLFILGLAALLSPIYLSAMALRGIILSFIFSAVLLLTVRMEHTVTRKQGLIALTGYIVFVVILFFQNY